MEEALRKRPRLIIDDTSPHSSYDHFINVGEGTFGFVWQANEKETKKKVAVKKFKGTKEGEGISLTAYREIMVKEFLLAFYLLTQ